MPGSEGSYQAGERYGIPISAIKIQTGINHKLGDRDLSPIESKICPWMIRQPHSIYEVVL
jgi:hypothetical protein